MPELKPLPCPACGSDAKSLIKYVRDRLNDGPNVVFGKPTVRELVEALETRTLTWSNEPPKVAGDYYVRRRTDESTPWGKAFVISFSEGYLKELTASPFWQYAGPIAPPGEDASNAYCK